MTFNSLLIAVLGPPPDQVANSLLDKELIAKDANDAKQTTLEEVMVGIQNRAQTALPPVSEDTLFTSRP